MQHLKYLIPKKINLVSFDFAGCGMSGGKYISLGNSISKNILNFLRVQ